MVNNIIVKTKFSIFEKIKIYYLFGFWITNKVMIRHYLSNLLAFEVMDQNFKFYDLAIDRVIFYNPQDMKIATKI